MISLLYSFIVVALKAAEFAKKSNNLHVKFAVAKHIGGEGHYLTSDKAEIVKEVNNSKKLNLFESPYV